mgnify:CR=1 FL=1
MKPVLVDTDILSEFLRGTEIVVDNVKKYLESYDSINFSIITYYTHFSTFVLNVNRSFLIRHLVRADNSLLPCHRKCFTVRQFEIPEGNYPDLFSE